MTLLLMLAGAVVLGLAMTDVVWTTIAAGSGAGPLTSRLGGRLWAAARAIHRRSQAPTVLTVAGVLIVLAVLVMWISLVLVGWLAIFASADGAVRASTTGRPGDLVDRIYFTGYTVFTLGLGDYVPGDGTWQLATVLASGSGLVLVTLSITYLVPVASAVVQRRQLAGQISSLGESGSDIVVRAWNGSDFGQLTQSLSMLLPLVHTLRLQHLTYPVLHYFHAQTPRDAAAVKLVHLDQALSLLGHGVAADRRPDAQTIEALDGVIGEFLSTMEGVHITGAESPAPAAALSPLADAGIPVDESGYRAHIEGTVRRRRLLAAYLLDDGWALDQVAP